MIKVFLADRPRHSPLCLMCDHWCWGCWWPGHWTGWTCQGLSLPPLPGLSWLLPCSVLRHHKTSRLTESLSTNQQPEFSRLDQSEARHRPHVSRPWWWPRLALRSQGSSLVAHLPIRQTDPRSPVLESAIVFKGNLCNQIFSKPWGPAGGKRIFKLYALTLNITRLLSLFLFYVSDLEKIFLLFKEITYSRN